MINVTLEELRYAVLHDDRFNGDIFTHDIDHVLEIALFKMAFTSMQSPVRIDLGNGEALIVSLDGKLPRACRFDLVDHLERQQDFSLSTFGPGKRTAGLIDHITKELTEIAANPHDVTEWVDVVMLALDGAWRAGYDARDICEALSAKLERNKARNWPDWRTADPSKAIEHVRDESDGSKFQGRPGAL